MVISAIVNIVTPLKELKRTESYHHESLPLCRFSGELPDQPSELARTAYCMTKMRSHAPYVHLATT